MVTRSYRQADPPPTRRDCPELRHARLPDGHGAGVRVTALRPTAHDVIGTELATLGQVPSLAPEVTAAGLVLWRLRKDRTRQLWCEVKDLSHALLVRVHDPATARTAVSETYHSIQRAVDRAESLRRQYRAAGWQLEEPDPASGQ